MSLPPDIIFDRMVLKSRLRKWQVIAFILAVTALLALASTMAGSSEDEAVAGEVGHDYIARITVEGMILDDKYRNKALEKLKKDKHAKAVILSIDSPGGTTAGGEELYGLFRDLSDSGKPVVVVMHTLAASGGYMIALAGDKIYARKGTITGSIGVLMQSAEFTEMAEKLGVKLNTIKSAELKASPSPFEKMTPKAEAAIKSLIDDFYNYFVDVVAERRHLPRARAAELADGRVYSGNQAVQNGLVDAIGGEKEALEWLYKDKKISTDAKVKDISTTEPEKSLKDILFGDSSEARIFQRLTANGLLAVWQP